MTRVQKDPAGVRQIVGSVILDFDGQDSEVPLFSENEKEMLEGNAGIIVTIT